MSDSVKNITGAEALETFKMLIGHARSCQMQTGLNMRPIPSRPMGLHKAEDDGSLYFLSSKNSNKNRELSESPEMQLEISNDGNNEYLSMYGKATVNDDRQKIEELYTAFADNWFDGKDDPNISVIHFTPESGHYWDNKHGKLVQFAGMLMGAITGKQGSDGIQGDLSI